MLQKLIFDNYHKDFPLFVVKAPKQTERGLHTHDFTELVIVLDGAGIHYNEKESTAISGGDCFVVNGTHGYLGKPELNIINILYVPERLPLPWDAARKLAGYNAFFVLEPKLRGNHDFQNRLHLSPPELATVSKMIDRLETELLSKNSGFEIMALAAFIDIIGYLSRVYERLNRNTGDTILGLSEVISTIENHSDETIHLKDLVKMACMSESQLLRKFKEATGYSPIDYHLRLRIRKATVLMEQTSLNFSEISRLVGFNDTNYFTRQFKRVHGISPRTYRELNPQKKH